MIKEINFTHFFKNVCIYLSIHDWKIEFSNDNFCSVHKKTITVDLKYKGDVKQIILHEITHINTCRFSNQKHNCHFWKQLEHLTSKFLKRVLDKQQLNHKKYTSVGIYKLSYENIYKP